MLAMTLWQPMAHAVIHLSKDTENRPHVGPWKRAAGRTIAVHAGLTWNDDHAATVAAISGRRITHRDVPFGAIIGTVDVTDVHWSDGECCDLWGFDGHAHLTLARPRALTEPIPCRGALGLWTVPADIARQLDAVRR